MSKREGFSFVELVLVMAIIAIVAGIAIPRYAHAIASYRAATAAHRVVSDIYLAQSSARGTSSSAQVVFSPGPNGGYTMAGVKDLETGADTYTVSLAVEPYLAQMVSATTNSSTKGTKSAVAGQSVRLTFDGYGVGDADLTVVIQSGSEQRTVRFDRAAGRCAVQ
jgi:prepilin-type N-terminal cleavage/methylation domain-containing protein